MSAARPIGAAAVAPSHFREVFESEELKLEFVKFLQTIFYQLDETKVLAKMEELLANPERSDEEIYNALLNDMGNLKRRFPKLLQLWSLRVVKRGMGEQASTLLKGFDRSRLHDYMEVYNRRYAKVLGIPLDGKTVAAADTGDVTIAARIEAGALFSRFPYTEHVPLNDPDCKSSAEEPEKTMKPIGDEVADGSIDLVGCLGGLHHTPPERVVPFAQSLRRKLKPGGILLLRDHDTRTPAIAAIASVVHTFVNASNGVSWEEESKEIREFRSLTYWTSVLEREGFRCISPKGLVLKDDPTYNSMIAFVKTPTNLEELRHAARYRSDCMRPQDGTRATWIEWGHVRSSKQYAEFIQEHHSYAFDYIGHLRQHWQYCYHYVKESLHDGIALKQLIFSDNFLMNLFILFSAAAQCLSGYVTSLPSQLIARCRYGAEWRTMTNLTELEKYEAQVEDEYCRFIDHTPFYMFDYAGKIKGLWKAATKWDVVSAVFSTVSLLAKAAVSAPVRMIYTSEQNLEPDKVSILVKDPENRLDSADVIDQTPDGHKLLSVPRYRPFTELCKQLSSQPSIELLEVGNQPSISVDVVLGAEQVTPEIAGARVIYEMDKLQDAQRRRYVTYQVNVAALQAFERAIGSESIEYVHE